MEVNDKDFYINNKRVNGSFEDNAYTIVVGFWQVQIVFPCNNNLALRDEEFSSPRALLMVLCLSFKRPSSLRFGWCGWSQWHGSPWWGARALPGPRGLLFVGRPLFPAWFVSFWVLFCMVAVWAPSRPRVFFFPSGAVVSPPPLFWGLYCYLFLKNLGEVFRTI